MLEELRYATIGPLCLPTWTQRPMWSREASPPNTFGTSRQAESTSSTLLSSYRATAILLFEFGSIRDIPARRFLPLHRRRRRLAAEESMFSRPGTGLSYFRSAQTEPAPQCHHSAVRARARRRICLWQLSSGPVHSAGRGEILPWTTTGPVDAVPVDRSVTFSAS